MNRALANTDPNQFRASFVKAFAALVSDEKTAVNLEKGVYNYTIRESQYKQIVKKWKNPQFCEIYLSRTRSVLTNLKKNTELLQNIIDNQITPEQFAFMTHQEMCPEQWRAKIEKKMKIDQSHFTTNIEASTDMFTCKKCKSKRCTFYEMQTRSADEPATIFITCVDCGKQWRN
jgi:transcription elongation factor S-II